MRQPQLLLYLYLAFILNIFLEVLGRRSLLGGLTYFFTHPVFFALNTVILWLTLSVALLVQRKLFVVVLVSIFWLGLGVANCILLSFRVTPLGAVDFRNIASAFSIMNIYLNKTEIVFIALLLLAIAAGIVFAWFKLPRYKTRTMPSVAAFLAALTVVLISTNLPISAEMLPVSTDNVADAYENCGFVYCFSLSVLDKGIEKPENYSEDTMNSLLASIPEPGAKPEGSSNLVIVQLESFFDPTHVAGLTFSRDPIPFFRHLMNSCSSGYLSVPAVGAGTANTEFEVLTGMDIDFFGLGEYPFNTVLQDSTCESVAYDLKELGYDTHAIHNNTGSFYGRNRVYPMLGFDSFTSLEYMNDVEYNETGWAKDKVLTGEIEKCLNSSSAPDLVYAVSVQPHGKYPSEPVGIGPSQIAVSGALTDAQACAWTYYLSQINEVDDFLKDLIRMLQDYPEPVTLVLFGDHIPALEITADQLTNKDTYQTEYVIWHNRPAEKKDADMSAYQLTSYVLGEMGADGGILSRYHRQYASSGSYLDDLKLLQYDMLYGEQYVSGGAPLHQPSSMQMGVDPIHISHVACVKDSLFVYGQNFTAASEIQVNGKRLDTTFISPGLIAADLSRLDPGDRVTVAQISIRNNGILSETAPYMQQ